MHAARVHQRVRHVASAPAELKGKIGSVDSDLGARCQHVGTASLLTIMPLLGELQTLVHVLLLTLAATTGSAVPCDTIASPPAQLLQ